MCKNESQSVFPFLPLPLFFSDIYSHAMNRLHFMRKFFSRLAEIFIAATSFDINIRKLLILCLLTSFQSINRRRELIAVCVFFVRARNSADCFVIAEAFLPTIREEKKKTYKNIVNSARMMKNCKDFESL